MRGYWETICDFWDEQPEIERGPADVSQPSRWSRVAGGEDADI